MAFLIVGLVLLGLKLAAFGPVAAWPWWWVALPFGLAVAWWWYSDTTGLTKKREMDKMEQRKAARRQKNLESLGLGDRGRKSR